MHLYLPSYTFFRRESRSMAMGLIIVGAALGMYLNFYFGNIGWNNILMFVSLLFLPNWDNLSKFHLPFVNRTFKAILIFQFICIIYLLFTSMLLGHPSDWKTLIYILFTIFMLLGIMSQAKHDMAIMRIVFYSWIFSWICLVFCGISLGTGAYFIEFAKMHDGTGYQSILLDLTMAGNLYTLVVCSIFYLNHGKSKQTIAMIGIILSLIFIIILGKRTPLLVSICLIILYILKFHGFTGKIKKSIVCYVGILLIILMILVVKIQGLSEQIGLVWEHSIGGVLDMINGTSTTGAAAVARYKFRQWAYMYIENNFTPFNYIFGAGFMTKWLDAPLLQAYLDMGIIGFCFYFYYVIVKPLRITFSKLSKNSLVFWGCALNFYNILSAFNSGIPYGHVRWIPLIGLLLTIHYTRQRELRQN